MKPGEHWGTDVADGSRENVENKKPSCVTKKLRQVQNQPLKRIIAGTKKEAPKRGAFVFVRKGVNTLHRANIV